MAPPRSAPASALWAVLTGSLGRRFAQHRQSAGSSPPAQLCERLCPPIGLRRRFRSGRDLSGKFRQLLTEYGSARHPVSRRSGKRFSRSDEFGISV